MPVLEPSWNTTRHAFLLHPERLQAASQGGHRQGMSLRGWNTAGGGNDFAVNATLFASVSATSCDSQFTNMLNIHPSKDTCLYTTSSLILHRGSSTHSPLQHPLPRRRSACFSESNILRLPFPLPQIQLRGSVRISFLPTYE